MSEQVNDPELLVAFFEESTDTLTTVANLFIELEQRPGDLDLVQAIFRPVHSLKGNSAFFGLLALKRLAHEMETVLDLVRKSKLVVTKAVISTLLAGLDELRAILERVRAGGGEIADQALYDDLLERQRAIARNASEEGGDSLRQAVASVEAYLVHHQDIESTARSAIEQLVMRARRELGIAESSKQSASPTIDPRLEELRTLVAASFSVEADATAVTRMGTLVEALPQVAGDDHGRAIAKELLDAWRTCVGAAGYNEILRDFLASQIEILTPLPGFQVAIAAMPSVAGTPAAALEPKAATQAPVGDTTHESSGSRTDVKSDVHRRDDKSKGDGKSIRVAEARIDTFLHHVGELLVVGDMFSHLLARVRQIGGTHLLARDFRRANDTFAQLSAKLQGAIMSIRKVPIRPQLAKVPRIVRDVATAKGKDISVQLIGEEVEVDKSLVELLDAPLTHLARNAADHGIEMPEQRLAAGKPAQGVVTISVQETDSSIVMTVADDGAGLNLDRIRRKAESLRLVQPGVELSQKDIINFIFASGLSTAEQVTDVSGRGVGMDVVRRMIEESGGSIAVDTTPGRGSSFRLTLPKGVTTQIMAGFLVRAGGLVLVLPLESVRETFRLRPDDISQLPGEGSGRLIVRQEITIPLLSLGEVLGVPTTKPPGAVVAIDSNRRRLALEVEAVLGVRKVVLRNLDGLPQRDGLYAGGALLGDGTVALILDPDALAHTREAVDVV